MVPLSETLVPTKKTLIGVSVLFLGLAVIFGALNLSKVKNLRSTAADAAILRENVERYRVKKESELKAREAPIAAAQVKLSERNGKTIASEEQLAKIQNENQALEMKLQAKEGEISTLQKQLEETQPASANPGTPSTVELQAQLDDARQQLDNAERGGARESRGPRHDFGRQPSLQFCRTESGRPQRRGTTLRNAHCARRHLYR